MPRHIVRLGPTSRRQITARDHHEVYTGSLQVEIGEPLDLKRVFRLILGLEQQAA